MKEQILLPYDQIRLLIISAGEAQKLFGLCRSKMSEHISKIKAMTWLPKRTFSILATRLNVWKDNQKTQTHTYTEG